MIHLTHRTTKVKNYASLVKFGHSIFALPFAITGFFMAVLHYNYSFSWLELVLVILCMVLARNAAMGFNRWTDAKIDKENPRTEKREIPSGIISKNKALIFVIINATAFVITTWFINSLVFFLSPFALFVILTYSYTKRFTKYSHFVLGLGLAIAPTAAFLVVSSEFETLPILLSAMVLFWTAGFDIIYSLQDEEFDKKNNLHSIPSSVGRNKALLISAIVHLVSIIILVIIGILFLNNTLYWSGALIFSALLIYQHIIVKPKDISRVNLAFGTLNGIASIVFAIFCIMGMLLY